MSKFRLDEVDHQILDMLIDNTRVPFTDIAKKLLISAGTVHVRVKKMEDAGIIMGSSLVLDYDKLGCINKDRLIRKYKLNEIFKNII